MPAFQRKRLRRADGGEALVDLGVHPRHEEGCDRSDGAQVDARRLGLLQPGQVRVDDLAVPFEAEDEGDVDADAQRRQLGDGLEAFLGRRYLDHDVGTVDLRPEQLALFDGAGRVVGDGRFDLDGYAAIDPLGGIVDGTERVASAGHVVSGDLDDRLPDAHA